MSLISRKMIKVTATLAMMVMNASVTEQTVDNYKKVLGENPFLEYDEPLFDQVSNFAREISTP